MRSAICLVTDERGYDLTRHSVIVATLTQETIKDIVVYCVGFTPSDAENITHIGLKRGFNVEFKRLSLGNLGESGNTQTHVTRTANLKILALNDLRSHYNRAIYIDGDVLLMKDIRLDKMEFESKPIAAAYDIAETGGITNPDFLERCVDLGKSPHYFNSGVIAVDYARWSTEFVSRFEALAKIHGHGCDYNAQCVTQDQCVMNMVFENNWSRLPLTLNFQACGMFSEHWKSASVRHYVGPKKFLPNRPERSDALEIDLVNRARREMGLKRIGIPGGEFAMRLNMVRNRRYTRRVCEAIALVERMRSDPL
jgi:lipopolysaccharide biosynthesis glycosyltransferase